jgi:hypothetical protein
MTAGGTETTARKQKKPQLFKPGQSGNPSGRPVGARNRATLAMEALLDGDAEAIMGKAIELAKAGDGPALRLCLDRLMPARRDRHVAANVEIDALLTSDEAKFCGCALLPTRELTAKEWATEVSL